MGHHGMPVQRKVPDTGHSQEVGKLTNSDPTNSIGKVAQGTGSVIRCNAEHGPSPPPGKVLKVYRGEWLMSHPFH